MNKDAIDLYPNSQEELSKWFKDTDHKC